MVDKLMLDTSTKGKRGVHLYDRDFETRVEKLVPKSYLRKKPAELPELGESEIMRYFVNLSGKNHHVDKGFYPLGSCTMKYNPKINEETAGLPGFQHIHPQQPDDTVQGALKLLYEIGKNLCEIGGLSAITLQPSAGAHGELTGLMTIRAYHESKGHPRKYVLVPDSAHGTNPASVSIAGYKSKTLKSDENGLVDIEELKNALDQDTAAFMLTNPNTLGLFEKNVKQITSLVHEAGGLVYMDGANMNALLGIVRPGDLGVDIVHFNLHKTFSTPHGGGGPGSGPIAVTRELDSFLPYPCVRQSKGAYSMDCKRPQSIGKVSSFYGNFSVIVRAYTYIRMLGSPGLRRVAEQAIINSNYLLSKVKDDYDLPYKQTPMHEFVISGNRQKEKGVKTLDIAKRLLDFGVHAPTVYFPLIVNEAMMIEPTETESRATLDAFAQALKQIATEVETEPDTVKSAPHTTVISRLDEAGAARQLNVRYNRQDE
ncbi:MAG: aminomethyl-transferring glycine dehydrogenase subunit GcvPB [candidate division KSB1 bacterium]|nr:aminomethyl-transferring glycine dehydrogenase subunit GcvPB [candidate division KSB1 bacterium]